MPIFLLPRAYFSDRLIPLCVCFDPLLRWGRQIGSWGSTSLQKDVIE